VEPLRASARWQRILSFQSEWPVTKLIEPINAIYNKTPLPAGGNPGACRLFASPRLKDNRTGGLRTSAVSRV